MTAKLLLFSALISSPAAAFLCGTDMLPFYAVFPAAALLSRNFRYFRNALLLSLAPAAALLWAHLSGEGPALHRSLRWICALAAGSYFAGSLGPEGTASVLRAGAKAGFMATLAESIERAGTAVRAARKRWNTSSQLPLRERISRTLDSALRDDLKDAPASRAPKRTPVFLAALSWLFFLGSVSGRM